MSPEHTQDLDKKMQCVRDEMARIKTTIREIEGRRSGYQEAIKGAPQDLGAAVKKLENKIKAEAHAIHQYSEQLTELTAKLSALEEAKKIFEKGSDDASELRPNSEIFRIREAMRTTGKPMTLPEIISSIGKSDTPEIRNNIRSSIGRYARSEKIFVQTAVNTYGLIELDHKPQEETPNMRVVP